MTNYFEYYATVRDIGVALGLPEQATGDEVYRAFLAYRAKHERPVPASYAPVTGKYIEAQTAETAGLIQRAGELTIQAVHFGAVIGTSDKELTPEHGTDNH